MFKMINQISQEIYRQTGKALRITNAIPLSGGSINQVYRLDTDREAFCIKVNDASLFPSMFEYEAQGLSELRKASFYVPEVMAVGEVDNTSFLWLEFISAGKPAHNFWEKFGHQLAEMHRVTSNSFGFSSDNYIGTLPQSNVSHVEWSSFFIEERIIPQIRQAIAHKKMEPEIVRKIEQLSKVVASVFPREAPALLHGDLWAGNVMVNSFGSPALIDPSVYYGHREMDIAMTRLFGGFDTSMYGAYNEIYPMELGWQERMNLYNLYPLLVHVNLFGGGYIRQVKQVLNHFTA